MLYKQPVSYKKVLYYLFFILGWIGLIIGVLDLFIAFAKKQIYVGTLAGFLWAGLFFILAMLAKKKKPR
jgi:hypothetical protein